MYFISKTSGMTTHFIFVYKAQMMQEVAIDTKSLKENIFEINCSFCTFFLFIYFSSFFLCMFVGNLYMKVIMAKIIGSRVVCNTCK